ncbi:MAG TPA: anti-sigma factor [Myxococcota bacterium]|nr:anti-sigma factor [Myxococcota bacterium]
MTCEERRELVFLYAAGELEGAERDELRAHLADGCPRCLGALAESEAAITRLAASELAPVTPPESVRRALSARIALESRMLEPQQSVAAPPPRRRMRTALAAGLAAAAAAAVVLAATELRLRGAERDADTRHAALELIGSPYMRAIELSGPALGFQGHGHLYWDYHSGGCYLRATQVRAPEPGKVYVLWFTDADGAPLRGGVLQLARDGEATLLTEMPRQIDVTGEVMVTAEKDPRVEQPSADAVLHGELQHF